ncbi:MAG: hypothetical protein Kow00105_06620 [Phycisphaeraceae bacterium]
MTAKRFHFANRLLVCLWLLMTVGRLLCPAEASAEEVSPGNLPVSTKESHAQNSENETRLLATFNARDADRTWSDDRTETEVLLESLSWRSAGFEVVCLATPDQPYDALVRFPSPKPSGRGVLDTVALQWYAARDRDGRAIEAPAVLLIHSLHPRMVVARQIAGYFKAKGIHAFVLELPGYGSRRAAPEQHPGVTALEHGAQAVADSLRAYDAIRALPNISPGPIAIQGTSLGGFVAATVGAIDRRFDPVVLLISGADGYATLREGLHDARYLRQALERKGYQGEAIRQLLDPVEPLHYVHRLDPERTWLISARQDQTIPPTSRQALVDAIGLDEKHHRTVEASHYTITMFLPIISDYMADLILHEGRQPSPIENEP